MCLCLGRRPPTTTTTTESEEKPDLEQQQPRSSASRLFSDARGTPVPVSPASLAYAQGAGLFYRGHDLETTYGLVAADVKVLLRRSHGADLLGEGEQCYMGYVKRDDVFVHACEGARHADGPVAEYTVICTFRASDAGQASVCDVVIRNGGFYANGHYDNLHTHFRGDLIDLETH